MKIGIVGGGITGLTTALALQKLGLPTVVYEQAENLTTVGAGIWLQPNAMEVLKWLGIKEQIKNQGKELHKMEITNSQLEPVKRITSDIVQDEKGNMTIAIHRARLQKILYDEVCKSNEVQLNVTYVSHRDNGDKVEVQFEGSSDQVDILLGADGIDSRVRTTISPQSKLRDSGQICWRGVAKLNLPDDIKHLGRESWGKQIRFGFSSIHDGEVYWFAVADIKHQSKAEQQGRKSYLKNLFQEFAPVVSELIEATEENAIHEASLLDLERLPSWHNGKVCLIGDAAHATTPNMGQGACQGIEDAFYLSQFLKANPNDCSSAFQQFEQRRRKKVDYVVNTSWQFGKMAHSSIGQPILKAIMKMMPERIISSQMNKIYAVEF